MDKKYDEFVKKKIKEHAKEKSITIALDFDGVIHSYENGWTGDIPEDPPMEGIEDFMKNLTKKGWLLKIFSTRNPEAIEDWLKFYKLDKYIKSIHSEKIPAKLYIDDRGYHFDGDFDKAEKFIEEFADRYEKKKES